MHLLLEPNTAPCMDGDIRLIGGASDSEGRIEVCYRSYWGSVCDHHWDDSDARVACRQLGFPPLGLSYHNSIYYIMACPFIEHAQEVMHPKFIILEYTFWMVLAVGEMKLH